MGSCFEIIPLTHGGAAISGRNLEIYWRGGLEIQIFRLSLQSIRGISSVGRAFEWHSKGQEFDSPMLHKRQTETGRCLSLFVFCGLIHPFTGERTPRTALWRGHSCPFTGERTPRTPCVASLQKKGGRSVDQLFYIFVGASVLPPRFALPPGALGSVLPGPLSSLRSRKQRPAATP